MSASRPAKLIVFVAAILLVSALVATSAPARSATDIRIVRDKFGVPHVFAPSLEDASYGVGYALAQDRLWQMHVFSLIAHGSLSHLFGPLVFDIDHVVRLFTYTEQERAARFATYPPELQADINAFVDGVNAWVAQVQQDPSLVPHEYADFQEPISDWTVDDTIALGDVLVLAFGSGGGNELEYAALLQRLTDRYGNKKGRKIWNDVITTVDDDSPISIPKGYDFTKHPTFAREAESQAVRELTPDARLGLSPPSAASSAPNTTPAVTGTAAQMRLIPDVQRALRGYDEVRKGFAMLRRAFHFGSNAQIVAPARSKTGNTLETAGPQVGYLLPQWLADIGIHAPGVDVTGMTFAGAGPAVLIGRGNGFAWTTTTGSSDLTDTYVEELDPNNDHQFKFNDQFLPMECRGETYEFHDVPFDSEEICRTVHGPVVSVDDANHVAYSQRYSWFNREGQTVQGFFGYGSATSLQDFATSAEMLASNHNMFYVDDHGNYGYWHPGNFPVRPEGVDLRLPQDGTGGSEWQGLLPIRETPHAVNFHRGWLANWNNQPAAGWERERAWPAIDNSQDIINALSLKGTRFRDPFGGALRTTRKLGWSDMSANLRYAAFKDHLDTFFRPLLPNRSALHSKLDRKALAVVRRWRGFLTDNDHDEQYDSAGSTIMDAWVEALRDAVFTPVLGADAGLADTGLLWEILSERDHRTLRNDWLGGHPASQVTRAAFHDAVKALAVDFDNQDPKTWRNDICFEHYQRVNADFAGDTAEQESGADFHGDSGRPGDVPDQICMDRGTYNHVVAYLDDPKSAGPLGQSASRAGSVIPPGQSGFINPAGQETVHYRDQAPLYFNWTYKPMPVTTAEVDAQMESEETITRP